MCVEVTSPDPPGFKANALFFPWDINFILASHSARVSMPSWLVSLLSKKPFRKVFSDSSLERMPSPLASPCLSRSSKLGIWKSLSAASPGDQPAKNRMPFVTTAEAQQAEGIPVTDHCSWPDSKE